uniref:Uncharacterized protein n=1 Tax=Anas zonorhyncha TaxID=75864 RepID=A0A8B9UTQ4_9AVES
MALVWEPLHWDKAVRGDGAGRTLVLGLSGRPCSPLFVSPDCRDLRLSPKRSCDQVPDELHRVPEEDAFQLQRTGAQR